jgi:RNA polymerase sigma-70 factor, ECF subfamily
MRIGKVSADVEYAATQREIEWVSERVATDNGCTDEHTIARIAGGDRQALTQLYLSHRQALFSYLLQLTPDYGLAEELLQDTLVAVWKSAHSFEGRSSVRTWLIGIARRQAHNALRQRGLLLADISELDETPAPDLEPEDAALANAARDELGEAFRQLLPPHREVLALIFVHQLSYQETAQVIGVPIGTVKSRLNHAKRALRALLRSAEGAQE